MAKRAGYYCNHCGYYHGVEDYDVEEPCYQCGGVVSYRDGDCMSTFESVCTVEEGVPV